MALKCIICGGTNFKKIDGQFVCQDCETSYTMEEVKKMAFSAEAAPAPAPVDNTKTIENYLAIARSSRDSGNNAEAENYSNKVLELDANNVDALLIKAEAVGWQSTLGSPRLVEVLNCYRAALAVTEGEKKEEIREKAKEVIHDLYLALFRLRAKNFGPYPDDDDANGLLKLTRDVVSLKATDASADASVRIGLESKSVKWARAINNELCDVWSKVESDFSDSNDGHPSNYDLTRVIDRGDAIIAGFKIAAVVVPDNFEENKEAAELYNQLMENIITIHEYLIDAKSYEVSFSGGWKHYDVDRSLTSSAKESRRKECNDLRKKGKDAVNAAETARLRREQEERDAAREAYWAEHQAEAAALKQEKEEIEKKIDDLTQQLNGESGEMNSFPELAQIADLTKQIAAKTSTLQSLGIFKKKEKKALEEEIAGLHQKKRTAEATLTEKRKPVTEKYKAMREQIKSLTSRIQEIDAEFTKDRI